MIFQIWYQQNIPNNLNLYALFRKTHSNHKNVQLLGFIFRSQNIEHRLSDYTAQKVRLSEFQISPKNVLFFCGDIFFRSQDWKSYDY